MWLRVQITTRNNPLPGKGALEAGRTDERTAAIAAWTAACIPASKVADSAEVVVDVVMVPGEVVLAVVADVGAVGLGTIVISRWIQIQCRNTKQNATVTTYSHKSATCTLLIE